MSNQYFIYNFGAEIQGIGNQNEVKVNSCCFRRV